MECTGNYNKDYDVDHALLALRISCKNVGKGENFILFFCVCVSEAQASILPDTDDML